MVESRYGFAARCEATALPRRNVLRPIRALPLVRAVPLQAEPLILLRQKGQRPNQGAQPEMRLHPRRGKAVASQPAAKPLPRSGARSSRDLPAFPYFGFAVIMPPLVTTPWKFKACRLSDSSIVKKPIV